MALLASHTYVLHKSNSQNWMFWDELVQILLVVTTREVARKPRKIRWFWKAHERLVTILHSVTPIANVSASLFRSVLSLSAGVSPLLEAGMIVLFNNMDKGFYTDMNGAFIPEYARFVVDIMSKMDSGAEVIVQELKLLEGQEVRIMGAFLCFTAEKPNKTLNKAVRITSK